METTSASVDTSPFEETAVAWLSTAGSQIFLMQLGFLCYEAGFVQGVWTQSIILKNIEDTFVGILTFICFGWGLSESPDSFYGIISIPTNIFLIGVDDNLHDQVFISAFFASTCATIISGAVLERMKNKAYMLWCFMIILINYSFVAHWVWHKDGWLAKLGFVDGAGALVIHTTSGMSALIAVWRLGPRDGTEDDKGKLTPVEPASKPIINALGAFILWYGWFAFNIASPITMSKGIGDAIGTIALVTAISPIAASSAALLFMYCGLAPLSYENLLSCLLAGLVAITGTCHTVNIWEAAAIGFIVPLIFFSMSHVVRFKWGLDDPLQVIAIHLFGGIYSCFMEGVFANDVYGTPGLVFGGYKHFGVQCLGIVVILVFNFCLSLFLWDIVMKKVFFRRTSIRVSILDTYLGTRLFDLNYDIAMGELLKCRSNISRRMLWSFHEYVESRFANEQLDFLLVVKIFNDFMRMHQGEPMKIAKYCLRIIDTYIIPDAVMCINVSGTQRARLIKIKRQLLFELRQYHHIQSDKATDLYPDPTTTPVGGGQRSRKTSRSSVSFIRGLGSFAQNKSELSHTISSTGIDIRSENIFNDSFMEVQKIVLPLFTQFLSAYKKPVDKKKFFPRIPFKLEENWMLEWDVKLKKDIGRNVNSPTRLGASAPANNKSDSLLQKVSRDDLELTDLHLSTKIGENKKTDFAIVFKKDLENEEDANKKMVVVIE